MLGTFNYTLLAVVKYSINQSQAVILLSFRILYGVVCAVCLPRHCLPPLSTLTWPFPTHRQPLFHFSLQLNFLISVCKWQHVFFFKFCAYLCNETRFFNLYHEDDVILTIFKSWIVFHCVGFSIIYGVHYITTDSLNLWLLKSFCPFRLCMFLRPSVCTTDIID